MNKFKILSGLIFLFYATITMAVTNIQPRPSDYLLRSDLTLSSGQVLTAGTRWYQPPDILRLKREVEDGHFKGDYAWAKRVIFGYELLTDTYATIGEIRKDGLPPLAQGRVMNCASCHAQGGTVPYAYAFFRTLTFFGLRENGDKGVYIDNLSYHRDARTRARDCGRECGSTVRIADNAPEMDALMAWLKAVRDGIYPGEGLLIEAFKSKADLGKIPGATIPFFPSILKMTSNPQTGEKIYEDRCQSCHGSDGAGKWTEGHGYSIPPLSGSASFSQAGGPLMLPVGSAFIRRNMPPDNPGSLSEQEALDVMGYVATFPRPSVWWQDYYFRHNACSRPPFLPLHVGVTPEGFPFSKQQAQFGPWQPIAEWLASDACRAANPPTIPSLDWDFMTLNPI